MLRHGQALQTSQGTDDEGISVNNHLKHFTVFFRVVAYSTPLHAITGTTVLRFSPRMKDDSVPSGRSDRKRPAVVWSYVFLSATRLLANVV